MLGRTASALLVCIALASCAAPPVAAAPAHRADGRLADWAGEPSWLAGQTRVSSGELIHDDWLYDDYGADLDGGPNRPAFRAALAPTRGDYRYPTTAARYGHNAADIRQVRIAADSRGLHLLVHLQTMKARDAAAITLAIDGPRGRSKTIAWPHGAGLRAPGADRFVTFWGTGGWITDFRGRRERLVTQAVNLSENAIEVDVPWRSLGRIRGRSVRVWMVSGLADPASRGYLAVQAGPSSATAPGGGLPGSTAAFDAAFNSDERFTRLVSHWGDEVQSQALAAGDVSDLGLTVDLAQLEEGESDNFEPEPGRFYNRIFRSSQDFGEGIELKNPTGQNAGGNPDPQFLSPFQPYGLYIPEDYDPGAPAPLLINGHSLDVNHNEYMAVSPNLYTQLGDERSSFVITPLARGMDTWYIDAGFEDVLEAWDDVRAAYTVDDDRTSIGGYSMGGYMTYRIGLLMPDRFAAAIPYVGPPAYQIWVPPLPPQPAGDFDVAGQTNNIVYNALNLPFEINNGGADELVPLPGPVEQAQTFREFGNPHLFYLFPGSDHFALVLADEWGHTRDWLDSHPRRVTTPSEVRYKRYPAMDLPQHGLRFDGAYWVDGMVVRDPGDACSPGQACETQFGLVEAYTMGHGRTRSVSQNVSSAFAGPPMPATVEGSTRADSSIARRDFFDLRMANVEAIALDMDPMGIAVDSPVEGNLTVDGAGPFRLTLEGGFPPVSATLDGEPVPVQQADGEVVLDLELSAQHTLEIQPR